MDIQQAFELVRRNAEYHQDKQPTLGTLLEEVAELVRALEGTHEHDPELELIQIGGIVINMLSRYDWINATGAVFARYKTDF